MTVILKNMEMAWSGWKMYTDHGKLAALLLASLVFLWYYRKNAKSSSFLGYTITVTICCICPVTAGLLMVYQTKFYDYEWIWSLVPVTAAIAYGATILMEMCWGNSAEGQNGVAKSWGRPTEDRGSVTERRGGLMLTSGQICRRFVMHTARESGDRANVSVRQYKLLQWRRGIPVTALLLAIILLSGGLGRPSWDRKEQAAQREHAYELLDQIVDSCSGGQICLWAPREIMAYARERDDHIRLPYGRNMWDISLNAYAYDTYDEQTVALYQWMEQAGKADTIDKDTASVSLEVCVKYAQDAGVDCVVLPETVSQETIQRMETALHTEARLLEGYWIFYERAD